jgi:hypothetical protein
MKSFNVHEAKVEFDDDPDGFRTGYKRMTPGLDGSAEPAPASFGGYQTFCGT